MFSVILPAMPAGGFPLVLLTLVSSVSSCFPGPFGFGLPPAAPILPGGYYGGMPAYGGMYGPRMGPFRSEGQKASFGQQAAAQQAVPHFQAQMDEVQSAASLNCPNFNEVNACKWGNTNDEELDWVSVSRVPDAERWFASLDTHTYPDTSAGALVSAQRQGWEGGRLVSDFLSCIGEGLRLTATVWRTKEGTQMEQPRLQVCTRNQGEERLPLVNCNDFDVRNGVPITIEIPAASDPLAPAQIVIHGYNFMAPQGGAIFLQDIVVEGTSTCNPSASNEEPPTLIQESKSILQDRSTSRGGSNDPVGPLKVVDGLNGLEAINAAPRNPQFEENSVLQQNIDQSPLHNAAQSAGPSTSIGVSPTLFESCLALSCNPSDLSCKFWRSAGNNRWEIGSANRISNPLTGIHLPPGTSQKFLVAPFMDSHINSYTLVSESLTIPPLQDVYFCFYEYYATHGLSLVVCSDRMDCFYQKNSLLMGSRVEENKKWNIRCAKLPAGTYELRVIAENNGDNKGEVGFLPIRLARDPEGRDFIC